MAGAFHGTPITSANDAVLKVLGARNYCVSFFRPDQIALIVQIALCVMLDNGAFSAWRQGLVLDAAYWQAFWEFVARWLPLCPLGSFFVIPDVIDAGTQEQDALIRECPAELLPFAWPVWHMDEPISRLLMLCERFGRVCIGSTAEYQVVGSPAWRGRMDEVFNALAAANLLGKVLVHMLRGLQCFLPSFDYPMDQADSADMGRNHNRLKRYGESYLWAVRQKTNRWDRLAAGCTTAWPPQRLIPQPSLFGEAA